MPKTVPEIQQLLGFANDPDGFEEFRKAFDIWHRDKQHPERLVLKLKDPVITEQIGDFVEEVGDTLWPGPKDKRTKEIRWVYPTDREKIIKAIRTWASYRKKVNVQSVRTQETPRLRTPRFKDLRFRFVLENKLNQEGSTSTAKGSPTEDVSDDIGLMRTSSYSNSPSNSSEMDAENNLDEDNFGLLSSDYDSSDVESDYESEWEILNRFEDAHQVIMLGLRAITESGNEKEKKSWKTTEMMFEKIDKERWNPSAESEQQFANVSNLIDWYRNAQCSMLGHLSMKGKALKGKKDERSKAIRAKIEEIKLASWNCVTNRL